jgi:NAD(P)-dependent dehydrogenase (short-subunit alcohol dehydrogenase family)
VDVGGTLAVVGAGPGLGVAIARRFGEHGFQTGLVARDGERLGREVAALPAAGAYPADVTDGAALRTALDRLQAELGPIDVLAFTPGPGGAAITPAADVTPDTAAAQFALHVRGAVTAVRHVLPGMLAHGTGTVLLTTGASSVVPIPALGDVGIAMAGLRNWALGLHAALAPRGVFVATVTIATAIQAGGGEGDPDAIAARYLDLHERRDRAEEVIGDLDTVRRLVRASR